MTKSPGTPTDIPADCRSLLDSLQAGVIIHDARGRVLLCNQRVCEMLGVTQDEALGRGPGLDLMRYREDLTPYDPEDGAVMRALKTGQAVEDLVVGLQSSPDQPIRWLLVSARPEATTDGRVARVVATCMDVTQRKELEAMREHAERMVRHDLKSPLSGMIAGLRYMLDLELSDEAREMTVHALEHGKHCLRRIEESAALYRMERDDYVLRAEEFNLARHLRALPRTFAEMLARRRLGLRILVDGAELDESARLDCYGEAVHVDAMLQNMVQNALEAAPQGGQITIRADARPRGGLSLAVHNPGAAPEPVRERFFERYVTYGKPGGSGLGAYIARLVAQAHGGSITMRASDEDDDTTVTVDLPGQPEAD
jgi:PAS domain S-box-containing protein